MPITIDQLVVNEKPVKLSVGNETLTVIYRPGEQTIDNINKFVASEDIDGLTTYLSNLLVSWDLYDGKKKVGTDKESLARLPLLFIKRVNKAIAEDADDEGEVSAS